MTIMRNNSFFGAKSGSGMYQAIINLMPPHDQYIEAFLGSGAIMRLKPPAVRNIGLDLDQDAVRRFSRDFPSVDCELFTTAAYGYLKNADLTPKTLIYCDPPYLHSTRTSRKRYKYEMTDSDHLLLIELLKGLDCFVMVSGYRSEMYDDALREWFSLDFQAMSRGGVRTETVWCNFEPSAVHYHTYAGSNFTDRQRIKRKAERWAKNYEKLPMGERQAVLAALLAVGGDKSN